MAWLHKFHTCPPLCFSKLSFCLMFSPIDECKVYRWNSRETLFAFNFKWIQLTVLQLWRRGIWVALIHYVCIGGDSCNDFRTFGVDCIALPTMIIHQRNGAINLDIKRVLWLCFAGRTWYQPGNRFKNKIVFLIVWSLCNLSFPECGHHTIAS